YPFGEGDNKMAVTVYGVYYNYDFGPNYVRNIGIANIATNSTNPTDTLAFRQNIPASGAGASFPHVGTGSIFHLEAGLLLPPNVPGIGKLQPYATFTYSKFNRLNDPMVLIEGGVNWFLEGHHAKFTLHYRNRPVFKQQQSGTGVVFNGPDGLAGITIDSDAGRKSELILQAMVYF
ncbi:MAG: hypothetical protein IAF08_10745, partial [Rhizobacter sp.]|nr:hypothetical protein [Chlorobiales bacterium]